MKHVNDNSDNPFDAPMFEPFIGPDVHELFQDAARVNEFLSNIFANYPEMGNSPLWQEVLSFAVSRYCDLEDACNLGGAA